MVRASAGGGSITVFMTDALGGARLSTNSTAGVATRILRAGHPGDDFLMEACHVLKKSYKIGHSTLQIEIDENNACSLAPDSVV